MIKPTLFLLLWLPIIAIGQKNDGITFRNDSWNQLLASAKTEKKIIFIDAYASWCRPCKMMSKDIFTDPQVGAFFNANFINAKIDMEEGEGVKIAEQFAVGSYPSFLFVDGNGKILHRAIGYIEVEEFLQIGSDAKNPEKQYYSLRDRFDKGTLTDEQLYTVASQSVALGDERAGIFVETYLKKQTNLLTKSNITLILSAITDPTSPYFDYLSKNEKAAGEIIGVVEIRDGLDGIAFDAISGTLSKNEPIETIVKKIEEGIKKYRPARNARRISIQVGEYLADQDDNRKLVLSYRTKMVTEFKEKLDWKTLYAYAMDVVQKDDMTEILQTGLGWAIQSIKLESNYYTNDVTARLYYKLKNKGEALKYAEKAIALGKEAGEDISETEDLLKRLK
ncbi:MAG: thioredoxin family protein [Bacteroidota bacterium]